VPIEAVFHREDGEVVYVKKVVAEGEADKKNGKAKDGEPKATPNPRDAWKEKLEERKVETGIASISHAQIIAGLVEGDEVALEDPTRPKKKEENR